MRLAAVWMITGSNAAKTRAEADKKKAEDAASVLSKLKKQAEDKSAEAESQKVVAQEQRKEAETQRKIAEELRERATRLGRMER